MPLPDVRPPTQEEFTLGKICRGCRYWTSYRKSYTEGFCGLIGNSDNGPPRWSSEANTCDSFNKEN